MKKRIIAFGILLTLLLAAWPVADSQAQCAMCRASVESSLSSGESSIGAGLNKGILFLLAMPYLAITIIALLWYRASTRERTKRQYVANVLKQKLGLG